MAWPALATLHIETTIIRIRYIHPRLPGCALCARVIHKTTKLLIIKHARDIPAQKKQRSSTIVYTACFHIVIATPMPTTNKMNLYSWNNNNTSNKSENNFNFFFTDWFKYFIWERRGGSVECICTKLPLRLKQCSTKNLYNHITAYDMCDLVYDPKI